MTISSILTILVFLFYLTGKSLTHTIQDLDPDYKNALKLSLLFYEAQRSGKLPPTNRIKWRGDSALNDRGINGEDLTGGYYDAADFVKFSFTMAFTTTILSWGLISYKDAYKQTGQYRECLDAVKWATDYFIKCHVAPYEFYGQVGDFMLDKAYWGRPEEMNVTRSAYKIDKDNPGSDLAGEASAAFSSASMVFRDIDEGYANELLRHSQELYSFARHHRGLYHLSIPQAKSYYESTGYGDELVWAALWLFKATNDNSYIEQAENYYHKFRLRERPNEFFYNQKVAGLQVLLAELSRKPEYMKAVKSFCDFSKDEQIRTPKGLIYIEKFGTLSHAANIAFVCLQAAHLNISAIDYVNFAKEQIDYMLGSSGRSFVVGFGDNYPKRPHHAASSCPDKPAPCNLRLKSANPHILYGALVSGPDQNDKYEDNREEFLYNEVTLDFNAGFQSAVAGLIYHQNRI